MLNLNQINKSVETSKNISIAPHTKLSVNDIEIYQLKRFNEKIVSILSADFTEGKEYLIDTDKEKVYLLSSDILEKFSEKYQSNNIKKNDINSNIKHVVNTLNNELLLKSIYSDMREKINGLSISEKKTYLSNCKKFFVSLSEKESKNLTELMKAEHNKFSMAAKEFSEIYTEKDKVQDEIDFITSNGTKGTKGTKVDKEKKLESLKEKLEDLEKKLNDFDFFIIVENYAKVYSRIGYVRSKISRNN